MSSPVKFTYKQVPVVGEDDLYYARRYDVSVDGERIGHVNLCHSNDWAWSGMGIEDITTATRSYAAEKLYARYLSERG